MKKLYFIYALFFMPFFMFAEATVTDSDMWVVLQAIGCILLVPIIIGAIIGLIASGIRTIRGWLNI